MTTTSTPRRRTHGLGATVASVVLAAAGVLAYGVLGVAAPARAHDQLLSSTPGEEGHVDAAPTEVSMVYSDSLIEVGAVVLVMDDDDKDWAEGPVALEGPNATQALSPGMPDGIYQVRWRVVSSDGHPIAGVYDFSVGTAELTTGSGTAAAAPAEDSLDPAAAGPDTTDSAAGTPASSTVVVGFLGALAGLAVFGGALWFRGRRHTP